MNVTARRWWWLPTALALLIAASFAASRWAHRLARDELVRRCASATFGACSVGAVALDRAGLVARDLSIRGFDGTLEGRVALLSARLSWWDILRRRTGTPIELSLHHASVTLDASGASFEQSLRRWFDARRPTGGPGRVRIARLEAEGVRLGLRLTADLVSEAHAVHLQWTSDGPLRASWTDVSARLGPTGELHSGRCLLGGSLGERDLSCDGSRARIDGDAILSHVRSARARWNTLRAIARNASNGPSMARVSDSERALSAASLRVRARDGAVEIARSSSAVATFSNAIVALDIEGGEVRRAHARFGNHPGGPALTVSVTRPRGAPWRGELAGEALPLREVARWAPWVPWADIDRGQVDVRGTVIPRGTEAYALAGSLSARDFGISHRRLSGEPLTELSVTLEGSGVVDIPRRRVETPGLTMSVNGVRTSLAGFVERGAEHVALEVRASLERTSCDGIRRSLSPSLLGPIAELSFGGEIEGEATLALDTRDIERTRFEVNLGNGCSIARDRFARGVARFSGPFVQRVQEPERVRAFVTGPGTAAWVPLADVSPHVINAVLSREDGCFYRHGGVDVGEIRHAIVRNVSAGRFVYGASTLSMQLAKNVFLAREKTLIRKLQELVLTWYLERTLGKDAILELYLNVVEFGPGLYGIGPATRFYFGIEPSRLAPLQAIFLATLLPNPVQRSAVFSRGTAPDATLAMLRAHARIMLGRGLLTAEDAAAAAAEPLSFRPRRAPIAGALTLEVDPALEDAVAVQTALTVPVPTVPEREAATLVSHDDARSETRQPTDEPSEQAPPDDDPQSDSSPRDDDPPATRTVRIR